MYPKPISHLKQGKCAWWLEFFNWMSMHPEMCQLILFTDEA